MLPPRSLLAVLLASTLSFPLATSVSAASVQKEGLTLPPDAQSHRDDVVKIFRDSYSAYKQFAFGHDDLAPVSKGFIDSRNGWGATIVDAMSTMSIMGENTSFSEAVQYVSQVDFSRSKTDSSVSVFETTIRYIGGLISAYELSGQKEQILITKAQQIADKLAFAWIGGNDVPFGHMDFETNTPLMQTSNIAEAGSLALEWATLSKYTGNDTYRVLSEKALRRIATNGSPLPGLPAQGIEPATGQPVGGYVTWGGGSDSYFEYLIKYARLNNTDNDLWADSWKLAVDSSIRTLLKESTVKGFTYLADYDSDKRIRHMSSHLACFHGGNWLLGGRLTNNQTLVDIALRLVDSCWNTYASTATGIGPEVFGFISDDGDFTGGDPPNDEQRQFHAEHGFYSIVPDYILRPEVLESNFYAWRVTGDTKYVDRAASAVASFQKYLQATVGYVGLEDVNDINSRKLDDMESFWFAEVLKYLYLTFDDPLRFSLNDYVFNTEAHPFKVPPAKETYGSPNGHIPAENPSSFTLTHGKLPAPSPVPVLPPININDLLKGLLG